MKVSELMKGVTPNPEYKGEVQVDDMVLAVDLAEESAGKVANYLVVGDHVTAVDGQLNPTTEDRTYIRKGTQTSKTGQQRSFSITGDRLEGDEFQDAALSHKIKYGRGNTVKKSYVYFNMLTGKGEKGEFVVIVNSDGGSDASTPAGIDIELRGSGGVPEDYTYSDDSGVGG